LPAAIAASVFVGFAFGASDAPGDGGSSYEECLLAPDTTLADCEKLR
jgi:hypothetical protein